MLNQTVVKFGLPNGLYYSPTEFRDDLARDKPGKSVGDVFFHKNGPEGPPMPGRPPIRIIGGGTWIGAVAEPGFGGELLSHMPYLLETARSKVGLLTVRIEETELACVPVEDDYFTYFVRNMVLRRRATPGVANTPEYKLKRIKETLLTEMKPFFLARNQDVHDHLDIEVELVKEKSLVSKFSGEIADAGEAGRRREVMDMVDARLCMNVKIKGIWQIGSLRSRGYGRVFRDLPVGNHARMAA